ncbi:MAG: hypothetical protein ACJAS1_004359, partial [Oleiphilaceae bacterium]
MNQSNQHFTELEQFTKLALEQLKLLGYSKKSLYRYTTTWQHFVEFTRQQNLDDTYSEELAALFVESNLFKEGKL